eukprot:7347-Heterococcus_DN1.PRE.6
MTPFVQMRQLVCTTTEQSCEGIATSYKATASTLILRASMASVSGNAAKSRFCRVYTAESQRADISDCAVYVSQVWTDS